MLVVTRKRNEAVIIGDGIEVRVIRTGRDGVRLGITAPPHVGVYRHELWEQIRNANSTAASGNAPAAALAQLRGRMTRSGRREAGGD
jgi:carbon storage regulator